MNYRINSIIENTQIFIIEFEYLQGDSIILDCDSTRWMIVTQSYCKWFHSKIIFRNQMMTKIVIWLNLIVASACTFQVCIFFDSKVFYMFWGIHRLQICSNWIYRTKVMNFMVFISHFCYFIFIPKLCTVPLFFIYYTLQGFQGYQICKIWPSGLFSKQFTRLVQFLWFEIQILFDFHPVD
jgi:hypothetical protein